MIRLGSLTLKSGVVQSPMAACTDLAFRLIAREKGLEFAFLEMVAAHALVQRNHKTLELMKTLPEDRPVGAQLVGCDPDLMGQAAAMIEDMGYDLLDLNLGCPVPKITGGGDGAGSALLQQPAKAESIFKKVVASVKRIPVTVKMRLGYGDPSGAEAADIAKRAQDAGVQAVAVHGRTRMQKYSGRADYAAIGRVKQAVSIPVIGNGDIHSPADAVRMKAESGCDAVMIGRGALGNPWIYKNVEAALRGEAAAHAPTFEERKAALLKHMALEARFEGERLAVLHMRRIGCWYFNGLPGAAAFRDKLCRTTSIAQIRELIESFGAPQMNQSGELCYTAPSRNFMENDRCPD